MYRSFFSYFVFGEIENNLLNSFFQIKFTDLNCFYETIKDIIAFFTSTDQKSITNEMILKNDEHTYLWSSKIENNIKFVVIQKQNSQEHEICNFSFNLDEFFNFIICIKQCCFFMFGFHPSEQLFFKVLLSEYNVSNIKGNLTKINELLELFQNEVSFKCKDLNIFLINELIIYYEIEFSVINKLSNLIKKCS